MSVGVDTMIGAGIFVLPGIVASKAGPAVLLSFATCGFISVLIALCMAELSTGMPYAGGGYLFAVRAIVYASAEHDLIVMSASNEWTLRSWLFGSIPDKVANRAPASVLMVRLKE